MADRMSFELVSPERKLATGEADMVLIPGAEGDLGAMAGHAPCLTTLRPGLVTVTAGSASTEYFVTGGFAEVSADGAAILAEEAVERSALTRDYLDAKIEAAEKALEGASDEARDGASYRLDCLRAAAEQLL